MSIPATVRPRNVWMCGRQVGVAARGACEHCTALDACRIPDLSATRDSQAGAPVGMGDTQVGSVFRCSCIGRELIRVERRIECNSMFAIICAAHSSTDVHSVPIQVKSCSATQL